MTDIPQKLDADLCHLKWRICVFQLLSSSQLPLCVWFRCSERALLNYFLTRLRAIDPDVLVGHNIAAFDLSVLLHRMLINKVSNRINSLLIYSL